MNKRTGKEWAELAGIEIVDNDGWRYKDGVQLDTPIDIFDFTRRASESTIFPFISTGAVGKSLHDDEGPTGREVKIVGPAKSVVKQMKGRSEVNEAMQKTPKLPSDAKAPNPWKSHYQGEA